MSAERREERGREWQSKKKEREEVVGVKKELRRRRVWAGGGAEGMMEGHRNRWIAAQREIVGEG